MTVKWHVTKSKRRWAILTGVPKQEEQRNTEQQQNYNAQWPPWLFIKDFVSVEIIIIKMTY